jgi:hypothetical protein
MDAPDKDKDKTEQDDKGFAVHDKRRIGKEDAPDSGYTPPETPTEETPKTGEHPQAESPGATSGEPTAAGQAPEDAHAGPEADSRTGERAYMPLTFTSFIMSLSTSALIYLGQVPDPVSGKTITDLVGARQTIDLISLLKEKTAGNLTPDEEGLIDGALYDLRMLFVKANS